MTVTNSQEFVTLLPKKRTIVTQQPKNVTPPPKKWAIVTKSPKYVTNNPKNGTIVTESLKNVTQPPQKQQHLGHICVEVGMRNRREEENWTYNGRYIK